MFLHVFHLLVDMLRKFLLTLAELLQLAFIQFSFRRSCSGSFKLFRRSFSKVFYFVGCFGSEFDQPILDLSVAIDHHLFALVGDSRCRLHLVVFELLHLVQEFVLVFAILFFIGFESVFYF